MAQVQSKAATVSRVVDRRRAGQLTEQQARLLLEEHARSGMTVSAFCLSKGFKRDRLVWWQKKFARVSSPTLIPTPCAPRLLPVTMASARTQKREAILTPAGGGPPKSHFELCLGEARRLRVPQDFQEASLQKLLRVLAEAP
jgi:hypothetical protein